MTEHHDSGRSLATPWPIARQAAAGAARRLSAESVPLAEALGRTLADPVVALCDLPGFDTSAMDGWATAGTGPWRVIGQVLAGDVRREELEAGTAVVIATGAAVPVGADAIVRREDGNEADGRLTAHRSPGRDIRPQGAECRRGDVLVDSGTLVRPGMLGLLAAAGHDDLPIVRVPRARILVLGDELLDAGVPPIGSVRDALTPQLPGWVASLGGRVAGTTRVPDRADALVNAIATAVEHADVVLTTGGTAAGPVDWLHDAVRTLGGRLLVDSVAVRPGHPMLLALVGSVPLVGLPGNPQSAVTGVVTLAAPVLESLLGRAPAEPETVTVMDDISAPEHEHRLVLGAVRQGRFEATAFLGSAMLRGFVTSAGFAVIPPGGALAGEPVPWLAFPRCA